MTFVLITGGVDLSVGSGIIFVAVLLDSTRTRLLAAVTRRHIRVDHAA